MPTANKSLTAGTLRNGGMINMMKLNRVKAKMIPITIACVMGCSILPIQAVAYADTSKKEAADKVGTYLSDLDYFSIDDWVYTDGEGEDSFGNHYGSTVKAEKGSMDYSTKNLTYYLGSEYSTLEGTLFIPKAANKTTSGHSYQWDVAVFTIYAEDEQGNETIAYQKDDFTAKMKPLEISVDVSGADYIRFEWRDACYIDTGSSYPLFELGNPMLYE